MSEHSAENDAPQGDREWLGNLIPLGFDPVRDGVSNVHEAADRILASDWFRERLAHAWDEGAAKASPHGGAYLRSFYAENPYRPTPPVVGDPA